MDININQDLMLKIEQVATDTFSEAARMLEERLARLDPSVILPILSFISQKRAGVPQSTGYILYSDNLISQSTLELIQAVYLTLHGFEESRNDTNVDDLLEIIDLADTINSCSTFKLIASNKNHDSVLNMQLATQNLRNWGCPSQVDKILIELLAPIDNVALSEIGFKFSDALKVLQSIRKLDVENTKETTDSVRTALKDMMSAPYHEHDLRCADVFMNPELLRQRLFVRSEKVNNARASLAVLLRSPLKHLISHNTEEIAIHSGCHNATTNKILDSLSLLPGSLSGIDKQFFLLANPIWGKPLIKTGTNDFICPIPTATQSFSFEILSTLASQSDRLKESYHKRRATYLEESIFSLCKKTFHGATLKKGKKWKNNKNPEFNYETDLIVYYFGVLIIIEAKSGSITPEARRGRVSDLKSGIGKLLIHPSKQAKNLEEFIKESRNKTEEASKASNEIGIDINTIDLTIRLSVILEDLGTLQCSLRKTKNDRLSFSEDDPSPAIMLSDLMVVFEILQDPVHIIHYLHRRFTLQSQYFYWADEIDLLGTYLSSKLYFPSATSGTALVFRENAAKPIDDYFQQRFDELEVARPHVELDAWWEKILTKLSEDRPRNWIKMAMKILNMSSATQAKTSNLHFQRVQWTRLFRETVRKNAALIHSVEDVPTFITISLTELEYKNRSNIIDSYLRSFINEHGQRDIIIITENADDASRETFMIAGFILKTNPVRNERDAVC